MTTLLLSLLFACGDSAAPPPKVAPPVAEEATPPQPPPAAAVPEGPDEAVDTSCKSVFTGDDATALYQFMVTLKSDGDCTFSDIDAKGSSVSVVYKTKEGSKVPVQLEPSACVEAPVKGAVVHDPYVLSVPTIAKKACPKAIAALSKAVNAGALPSPSQR